MGLLIGIGFKARSGKDTAGLYMERALNFKRTAFAYSLKEAIKTIFGWTDEHVYGDLKEVIDEFWEDTPRAVMQRFGTDACRNHVHQDIWVKSVEKRIADNSDRDWVITDVRFPNEAEFIHRLGGFVIRLDRDNPDEIAEGTTTHTSETAMDNYDGWDAVIDNNSTIEDLRHEVDKLVVRFGELIR